MTAHIIFWAAVTGSVSVTAWALRRMYGEARRKRRDCTCRWCLFMKRGPGLAQQPPMPVLARVPIPENPLRWIEELEIERMEKHYHETAEHPTETP